MSHNRKLGKPTDQRIAMLRAMTTYLQVERKYAEVMPNEKRLELCRAYGLIYYYRTGEKEEIAK